MTVEEASRQLMTWWCESTDDRQAMRADVDALIAAVRAESAEREQVLREGLQAVGRHMSKVSPEHPAYQLCQDLTAHVRKALRTSEEGRP